MPNLATPEDIVGACRSPKIKLSLRCTRCQTTSKEQFDWACVHPDLDACRADGWDGISLSRVFRCRHCDAVDDYELTGISYGMLTGGLLRFMSEEGGRVFIAEPRLSDGTILRRPSQALARLRELARQQPDRAEVHRRYGNGCERFGELVEAETAWRRALEVDANDVESAYSLAKILMRSPEKAVEGFTFLQQALEVLPKATHLDEEGRRNTARAVFGIVRTLVEEGEQLALMAVWDFWDRLVEFAASPGVFGLALTPELPEDEPTMLERLLVGDADPMPSGLLCKAEPVRVGPRVGRNAPCPCGSGKKYKRCCGGHGRNSPLGDEPAVLPGRD